jgi:hypothetical protein
MPGDVVEIIAPVTAFLKGDNLAGALSVDYTSPGSADPAISTGFHIEDPTGHQVAPATGQAQFGQTVVVPGLIGDDNGVTTQWRVVVWVEVGGDFDWLTGPPAASSLATWDIGTLSFDLRQVRHGVGFADTSPTGGTGP